MAEWKPIETAPKDGTLILIVNDDGAIDVAKYEPEWREYQEYVRTAKDGDVYKTVREDVGCWSTDFAWCPTYWMPLPAPPNPAKNPAI